MFETDQLAELVSQKHAVLLQLRDLAQRQLDLAHQGDPAGMISLMAVKQRLLDALMKIEKGLDPFRSQQPESRTWRTAADRARCADLSAQCQTLLNELMELDRHGMEVLQTRQAKTKTKIDAAHQAASARNAYVGANSAAHSIDLASDK